VSQASPAKATSANGSPSCSGSQKCWLSLRWKWWSRAHQCRPMCKC
jgi:hypothetical protein